MPGSFTVIGQSVGCRRGMPEAARFITYLITSGDLYLVLSRFIEEAVSEAKSSGLVDKWITEFGVEGKLSTPE